MIKLSFFEKNNISISWDTVLVGRKLKLAGNIFIEDYATKYLIETNTNNIKIIELAYGIKDDYIIDNILQKLSEKFLYALIYVCINQYIYHYIYRYSIHY